MISTGNENPVFMLSTDSVPPNLPNGQVVVIMDQGTFKFWDEENGELVPE